MIAAVQPPSFAALESEQLSLSAAPQVSVIVVTYNSERWIRPCLDSLLNQEGVAYEVLVVDNASSDATANIIEAEYGGVRFIRSTNAGFGSGNNVGARAAQGIYLAFVNPDTVAEPGWLSALVKPLEQPGIVTTSKILLLQDPSLINTCGNLTHFTGYSFVNGLRAPANHVQERAEVAGISGAAFAMRRKDFLEIGGFDEDFFLYMEDTELSWRIRQASHKILLIPDSQVRHSYSLDITAGKIYHLEKGRIILLRKHLRSLDWVVYAPSLLVAEALSWAWAASLGRSGLSAKRRATTDGWKKKLQPRQRPHRKDPAIIAGRRIPFETVSENRIVRALGSLLNALFWLNSRGWRMESSQRRIT